MMKLLLAGLIATGMCAASGVQAATGDYTVIGVPDCGAWIKEPSREDKKWLVGYLTARNLDNAIETKTNVLEKLDSAQQAFLWMDNWCKKNPLEDVGTGASTLFYELMLKKPK